MSFGKHFIAPYELLSVGVGNVADFNLEDSRKFCQLVGIKNSEIKLLEELHKDMNFYLSHLTPEDFIKNLKNLPYDKNFIIHLIDSNLNVQTMELQNFEDICSNIRKYVKKLSTSNPETKAIVQEILKVT